MIFLPSNGDTHTLLHWEVGYTVPELIGIK